MIQGPQLAQHAVNGTTERPIEAALPFAPAAPARTDRESGEPVVTDVTRTEEAEAVAQSRTLRPELVRAETMLQVAQEALAEIAHIHDGMRALAETALGDEISASQRADLTAAYQDLEQSVLDILKTTLFEGAQILQGGSGPNGEVQIHLPLPGGSGELLTLLIPPVLPPNSATPSIEGGGKATLVSPDAARAALGDIDAATRHLSVQDEMIAFQHATLHDVFATEIDAGREPGDDIEPSGPPIYAERLSLLAADILTSDGKIPFEDQAELFRAILEQVNYDEQPSASIGTKPHQPAELSMATNRYIVEPARAEEPGRTAETGLAVGQGPGPAFETSQISVQAHESPLETIEIRADGGEGVNLAGVPTVEGKSSPDRVSANSATAPVAAEAVGTIPVVDAAFVDGAVPDVTGLRDGIRTEGLPHDQQVPAVLTGSLPVGQGFHTIPAIPASGTFQPQTVVPRNSTPPNPEVAHENSFDLLSVRARQMVQPINNRQLDLLRLEAQQADLAKDPARAGPGAVPQFRDSDPRPEYGVSLAKSMFEAPAGQAAAGASLPDDQGGFVAELRRADNMLHVADLSIEQIELHLDYMRGLAEEAASGSLRPRAALDEVFQFVKSNVVDALAQTTEAQGEKILAGGDGPDGEYVIRLSEGGDAGQGHDIGIPSMRVQALSPDLADAHVLTGEAAEEAVSQLALVSEEVARTHERITEQRGFVRQLIHVEIAHQASRA
ncbi:MAG: hypothetical protein HOM58_19330 [Rhodospirillaceae bacterium]|jgi:flagellin-like hook-associated protein FlgL|nr:hypothetical protein [Rhodospirillaceae bacterium]MBT5456661.1 hypothetical protein [Rhodospirillaceae bacterium]